jgi:hypothetical protein
MLVHLIGKVNTVLLLGQASHVAGQKVHLIGQISHGAGHTVQYI